MPPYGAILRCERSGVVTPDGAILSVAPWPQAKKHQLIAHSLQLTAHSLPLVWLLLSVEERKSSHG